MHFSFLMDLSETAVTVRFKHLNMLCFKECALDIYFSCAAFSVEVRTFCSDAQPMEITLGFTQ